MPPTPAQPRPTSCRALSRPSKEFHTVRHQNTFPAPGCTTAPPATLQARDNEGPVATKPGAPCIEIDNIYR